MNMEGKAHVGLFLALSSLISSALSGKADYNKQEKWGGVCQTGTSQSPINIPTDALTVKSFEPFKFSNNANEKLAATTLENNGGSLVIHDTGFSGITVSGGGLPGEYQLLAPHFHWGKNELEGSEHLVNGKAFPLEMHAVTFKKEYGNIQSALDSGKSDALAVLGVMFTLAKDAEASPLDSLVDPTKDLTEKETGEKVSVSMELAFRDLLPQDLTKFYRYQGGLTTPGCNQQVVWTVFHQSRPTPKQLLVHLRQLKSSVGGKIDFNFRRPQQLNGRELSVSFVPPKQPEAEMAEDSSSSTRATRMVAAFVIFTTAFVGF